MIMVLLAVNDEYSNFTGRLHGLSIAHEDLQLFGDPVPCCFARALRKWGQGERHGQVQHLDHFVTVKYGLFLVGETGHERALSCLGRTRNVGNIHWDAIRIGNSHIGDFVDLVAYLRDQYWTCEQAEISLMDVWDNRDWTSMRHILGELCEREEHVHV